MLLRFELELMNKFEFNNLTKCWQKKLTNKFEFNNSIKFLAEKLTGIQDEIS